jgi:hypothetical protein
MPPSASPNTPAPVRTAWLGLATPNLLKGGPLRKLIGRNAERPPGHDWTLSAKALPKSRRPVWE